MNHTQHHNQPDQNFLSKADFLDSRLRERLIPPESLIAQMPIHSDHTLLDVGAGTGFFTIPMAERTSGKVYALDTDQRMLDVIKGKAEQKGIFNIELIQDYIEKVSIQNCSIDFVMASLILHEVGSLTTVLSKIYELLKPGGHLLCLEYEKDDLIVEGPPMSIRIASDQMQRTLTSAGFQIIRVTKISDAIYTVLAVKNKK